MRLAHCAIRTRDLAASRRFYVDVIGLTDGARPPFGFPGHWLCDASGEPVVHLIGEGADDYLGARQRIGSGAVDHVAFAATDWPAQRVRLDANQIPFDERTVPMLGQHQVFLRDPDGIVIELNYETV
jgi:catechol 2,3-dioxygenase-like lactoylglutathione lyase family enzyme